MTAHESGEVFVAPLDIVLSPYVSVRPDIFFIARNRAQIAIGRSISGAPDLAIDVVSR